MDEALPLNESSGDHAIVLPPQATAGDPAPSVTLTTNFSHVDASLHLHQAMLLPDPDAAERLERIHPGFMAEVMEGRRREQRARLQRERRAQEHEAALALKNQDQTFESLVRARDLEHQRFNAAVAIMALIALIFAVVGIVALLKGMYWPAGAMGLGMAYTFSKVITLLKVSKQ